MRGFDIARWRPRLILLEDPCVGNLSKHRYLLAAGYRIIRRYENNGWCVPRESAAQCRWTDRWKSYANTTWPCHPWVFRNLSALDCTKPVTSLISRRSGMLAGGFQSCVCS